MQKVIERATASGCAAGILAFNEKEAKKWLELGANFVAVTGDAFLLSRGMESVVETVRGEV